MRFTKHSIARLFDDLLANHSMLDYTFLIKPGNNGARQLFIYTVASSYFDKTSLVNALREFPDDSESDDLFDIASIEIIPVSNIPLTDYGHVDYQQLYLLDAATGENDNHSFHVSDFISKRHSSQIISGKNIAINDQNSGHKFETTEKPAFCTGGALIIPQGNAKTLVEAIRATKNKFPQKGIRYIEANGEEFFQSYSELYDNACGILARLQENGLNAGDHVILQFNYLQHHFAALWACILGGIIPTSIAVPANYHDQTQFQKLNNAIAILANATIIADDELVPSLHKFVDNTIIAISDVRGGGPARASLFNCQEADVLFHQLTSGSTGNSKCVQITHQSVIAHCNGIAQLNDYAADDINLNWLPLDHVAPIIMMHLKDLYHGIQHIVVKTERILAEPLRWLDYMEKFQVTHSWSPNFGFKLIIDSLQQQAVSKRQWKLQNLRKLMNAGEQVTYDTIEKFLLLTAPFGIKEYVMQPAYGMAETCTAITCSNNFSLHNPEVLHQTQNNKCIIGVGSPIPGVELRITDTEHNVLHEGEIGHLHVRGLVTTPGYLNNTDGLLKDNWFDTGDLGFIKNNSLVLTGREKEMIVIQGANYYCYDLESIVEQVPGVKTTFVGACGMQQYDGSETLALFFVPAVFSMPDIISSIKNIRKAIVSSIGISPDYVIPLEEFAFPKTTSGKIQRMALKKAFADGHYDAICREIDIQLKNNNTIRRWFFKRGWQNDLSEQVLQNEFRSIILFSQNKEFITALEALLPKENRPVIIEPGNQYKKIHDYHYQINPDSKEDYHALFSQLANPISHIIHCWSYENDKNWQPILESQSVLHIISALAEDASPINLLLFSNYSQAENGNDKILPDKTIITGMLRTITHENNHIKARHIDLDQQTVIQLAKTVLFEMRRKHSRPEVIYRNSQRKTACLERINILNKTEDKIIINGIYIITGGMGGIGLALAKSLLQEYNAKLVIVGRTPRAEMINTNEYQSLSLFSDNFIYETADVCDAASVSKVFKSAKDIFGGTIAGVFHLAANYHEMLLIDETPLSFQQITNVKTKGTQLLAKQLQQDNPAGLLVCFSSITAFFGGPMSGAYSAANRAMEAIILSLSQSTNLQCFCLAWSNWDDTGMSKGYVNIQSRGFEAISIQKGMNSLRAALQMNSPVLLVGIDDSKNNISVQCKQRARYNLLTKNKARGNTSHDDNTPTEKSLLKIWKQLLKLDDINVNDNFFEIGGNSLLLMRLLSEISKCFTKEFTLVDFFQYPSISLIAAYIDSTADKTNNMLKNHIAKRKNLLAARGRRRALLTRW